MEKEYKISWFKVMGVIVFFIIVIALFCLVIPKKSMANDNTLNTYINNINLMKESGFEYFQGSNLPDKIGESKSISLKELIDSKIIMEFHDETGKLCDVNNSYIKATKTLDNEYAMKVSLNCDNKSDYIVTTIANKNIIANNNENISSESNSSNVDKVPVINNKPNNNTTSGSVKEVINVNINYVNSCGDNCLNNTYYTVNFDVQGGDFVPRQIIKKGDVANYVAATKDGYLFLGWYLNNAEYNFNTPVTKQITLVAKWQKIDNSKPVVNNKYKIYFNSNGGTYVEEQEVLENNYVTRPNDPIKACYDFGGWYTDSSLTNYYSFNTPVSKSITLYAKWINNGSCTRKHTIIFESNGGSSVENQVVMDENVAVKPKDPVKTCYDFGGWYTDSNLTHYYNFNTPVVKDIVLYAKWINNNTCVKKYTVSFDSNGGNYIENVEVIEGKMVTRPSNPVRSGYIFKGWYYNGYEFNFKTKINHDYNLVAIWEKETIQYNKYCKIRDERFYSVSYVNGNKTATYYDWVIKFDNLASAKNVRILNQGYINGMSMYNDLYAKNIKNKGLSMVGDLGGNNVSYSAYDLRNYSLQSYNFSKYLSNAYYKNGNWYTNASVVIHNYNNANKYYAANLNKYIYFVPFYFDVEYTDMKNCTWDKATNASMYNGYQIVDSIYE